MPLNSNTVAVGLLSFVLAGLIGIYIYIGVMAGKLDNANEVSKHIGIIAGTTGFLLIIFTILSYYYFTTNITYATHYLLIMNGVNIFLSLLAVSVASVQVYTA
uniref:Uncharacterized protein n=1 Tax=viral metagenome TaxID=1070528 RepID=A0A6C0IEQ8_9ZZZZ